MIFARIFAAFFVVMTFSSAAGSSTSTSSVSSSSFVMRSPFTYPSSDRCSLHVRDRVIDVDAVRVVDGAGAIADRDDLAAFALQQLRRDRPTLPKPCTATVVPRTFMPRCASASFVTIMQPRPVASRRPSDPPISTGFPVTTAVTV